MTLKALLAPALLSILCSTLPLMSFATEGGSHGGGGAGICVNGKCIGLAEAGFRVAPEQRSNLGFQVDLETVHEIDRLVKLFPELNWTTGSIVGDTNTLQLVQIDKESRAKKFLSNYKKLIAKQGDKQMAKDTVLLGFTVEQSTFLIAERYNSLSSARSRALLLVHEANIRKGATQTNALRFDGALLDAMTALQSKLPMNQIAFLTAARDAKLIEPDLVDSIVFARAIAGQGWLDRQKLNIGISGGGDGILGSESILRLREYSPTIGTDLANPYFVRFFSLTGERGSASREDVFIKLGAILNNEMEQSGHDLIWLTQSLLESSINRVPVMRKVLEFCGTVDDRRTGVRSMKMSDINPKSPLARYSVPVSVDCAPGFGAGTFPKMSGANLHLTEPALCSRRGNTVFCNGHQLDYGGAMVF